MLAVFTVSETYDAIVTGPGIAPGTLRQAVFDANTAPGLDTIHFASNLDGQTITLGIAQDTTTHLFLTNPSDGDLDVSDSVIIDASGQNITIDANGTDLTPATKNLNVHDGSRIFSFLIQSGGTPQATIRGLTLQGADYLSFGGAVSFSNFGSTGGQWTIEDSTIQDNGADGSGGGVSVSKGSLIVSNTNFIDNFSGRSGGGLQAEALAESMTVVDSWFIGNEVGLLSGASSGGGIQVSAGTLNVSDSFFIGNTATNGGGIQFNTGTGNDNSGSISNTKFFDNVAIRGGGLHLALGHGFEEPNNGFTVQGSTFRGNKALNAAGGTAEGNGGAIFANLSRDSGFNFGNEPTFKLLESTIDLNEAENDGGGVYVLSPRGAQFEASGSTLSNNTALDSGGGLWLGFDPTIQTVVFDVDLVNTTISGNTADIQGGGLWIGVHDLEVPQDGTIDVDLNFVTITENKSPDGGGLYSRVDPTIVTTLTDTIVSGNFVSDIDNTANNVAGVIDLVGSKFNLFGPSDPGSIPVNADNLPNANNNPELGVLTDNGGSTETHKPLDTPTSQVIDAWDETLVAAVTSIPEFDQRGGAPGGVGFDRVQDYNGTGDKIDIGAVELRPDSLIPPRITDVKISSSSPNATHGTFSFATVDGSGTQLDTVPIGGADTIEIVFDEFVNVVEGDLTLIGLSTANEPDPVSGAFVAPTINSPIAKWTFQSWALGDNYAISLDADAITDSDGNLLDGEWVNPKSTIAEDPFGLVSTFPSGDLLPGGDFNFIARILPGDANLDGEVDLLDFSILSTWLNGPTMGLLFQNADFNGDGDVTLNDFSLLSTNFNANLQTILFAADINNDGTVSQSEVDDVSTNIGTSNLIYDLDNDGDVDAFDLAFAQLSFDIDIKLVA